MSTPPRQRRALSYTGGLGALAALALMFLAQVFPQNPILRFIDSMALGIGVVGAVVIAALLVWALVLRRPRQAAIDRYLARRAEDQGPG